MAEMMQLFRADRADLIARPMSIFTITATGNFRYSEDSCQNLIDCVEAGIPVEIVPVTLMGLIAPVTTVGATVFHTVDVLAGITMAQVIRPGAPVLFGGAPATFHMKVASSPMAAIEAIQLDAAYIAVAKALELPCQSYMALSDGPILDAQAGAETFGSALVAALSGVNSVSGPGMLDFLLVFNLPKLVFDDEMCGQALRFVREIRVAEDLPVSALIDQLMADQHLIMADHTMAHWPTELYLPSPIVDRDNRENWLKAGGKDTYQRAVDEVERRLAAYRPVSTDPTIDAELQRIIRSGLESQTSLPWLPPAEEPSDVALAAVAAGDGAGPARGRRLNPRRRASVD
jgi:trimethylamine--corrinoid protein Co-methyltransferase